MSSPRDDGQLGFERDIKALFRTKDPDSVLRDFDLFDYADVVQHADAILASLRSGRMPCDGPWPSNWTDSNCGSTRASCVAAPPDPKPRRSLMELNVNGADVAVDDRFAASPLLWVLRDVLGMRGTKYGCGIGYCAACTVLIDGQNTKSCQIPASRATGKAVTTLEGASGAVIDAVRDAWYRGNVVQCGYWQPGQTLAAAALLEADRSPDGATVARWMNGNLCRCGTYPRIRDAIGQAAATPAAGQTPTPLTAVPELEMQPLTPEELADPVHPYIRIHEDGTVVAYSNQIEQVDLIQGLKPRLGHQGGGGGGHVVDACRDFREPYRIDRDDLGVRTVAGEEPWRQSGNPGSWGERAVAVQDRPGDVAAGYERGARSGMRLFSQPDRAATSDGLTPTAVTLAGPGPPAEPVPERLRVAAPLGRRRLTAG
jgi:aerobic-type carbon monoxide dehydrogenase small subunit (CoxS/CutS family)